MYLIAVIAEEQNWYSSDEEDNGGGAVSKMLSNIRNSANPGQGRYVYNYEIIQTSEKSKLVNHIAYL